MTRHDYSRYGIRVIDEDGAEGQWFRMHSSAHDHDIREALAEEKTLIVCEIDSRVAPLKRDESEMFSDMSYEACRARYEASRNETLAMIRDGKVSECMSGIEYYPCAWDDCPPDRFAWLEYAMTWNGVIHIKCDWMEVLNAKHPQARGAK